MKKVRTFLLLPLKCRYLVCSSPPLDPVLQHCTPTLPSLLFNILFNDHAIYMWVRLTTLCCAFSITIIRAICAVLVLINLIVLIIFEEKYSLRTDFLFNLMTPNVNYSGRSAPLTSKVAFHIFIQQI